MCFIPVSSYFISIAAHSVYVLRRAGVISRGNAVPIVEKLPERMGTAFPLLKCLRTHKSHLKLRKKIKTVLDSYLMPNQES